jgi:AraC family transcriptional regulator, transcriptional activator of pobA
MVKIEQVASGRFAADIDELTFASYRRTYRSPQEFHVYPCSGELSELEVAAGPHRHDFFQIMCISEGAGTLTCDLAAHDFSGPVIAFFAPGRMHFWRHSMPPRGVVFGFLPSFFSVDTQYPGLIGRLDYFHHVHCPLLTLDEADATNMAQDFGRLLHEAEREQPARDDLARALITVILSKVRQHFHRRMQARRAALEESATALEKRFRIALDLHFPQLLRVSDYARILQVSRSYLSDELRRCTGCTAKELIHQRLLLEARRLLIYSRLSMAEIAYRLQFHDPSYFGRFFRDHAGLSPGAFREQFGTVPTSLD